MKQISVIGLSSSNDEEDDVSDITSSVSADSGFGSPESGRRSADSDCDSPKSKRRRVSFSEVDQVQKFVGGKEGDSRGSCASDSDTWHGFVGGISMVKVMKEGLDVRSHHQNKEVVVKEVEASVVAMEEDAVFREVD